MQKPLARNLIKYFVQITHGVNLKDISFNIMFPIIDISQIMAKSRDWDELQWVWTEWRRVSGRPIRDLYLQLVTLTNDAARMNSTSNFISVPEALNEICDADKVDRRIISLHARLQKNYNYIVFIKTA